MQQQAVAPREKTFTDYVRCQTSSDEPPEPERVEEILAALWEALKGELKRRGLWDKSPSYLGVYGLASWAEAERMSPRRAPGPGDGLELVVECFHYVFIERYPYLVNQLKVRSDIDGLIYRNVRNFLHDRQKKHDPLGFRVFAMVQAAVLAAVKAKELHVLAGDPRIRNSTVLSTAAATCLAIAGGADLEAIARSWNDRLLPDLITARGREQDRIVAMLRGLFTGLPAQGVECFRFGDLIDPFKSDVRARWGALFAAAAGTTGIEEEDDEFLHLVRLIGPDTRFEEWESFRKLADCITLAIERRDQPPATRRYLAQLWHFLETYAVEPGPEAGLPSRRKLASELGIPRNRMPVLYSILGELAGECRDRLAQRRTAPSPRAGWEPGNRRINDRSQVVAGLGRAMAEARGRASDQERELREQIRRPPAPGDVFVLSRTAELGVEWAVVERDPHDPRRLLAVPADPNPLAGRADVTIPPETACGPLTLRCRFAVWLQTEELDPRLRTGVLAPRSLGQVRHRRRQLEEGGGTPDAEADRDPEYGHWIEEVVEPARVAAGGSPAEREEPPPGKVLAFSSPPGWNVLRNTYGLAASLLLAVALGFAAGFYLRSPGPAERELDILFHPPLVTFHAGEQVRSQSRTIVLSSTDPLLLLMFAVDDAQHAYRLEISHQETRETIWSGDVPANELSELSVGLPTRRLPAGDYRLRLTRLVGDRTELVGDYDLTIERK